MPRDQDVCSNATGLTGRNLAVRHLQDDGDTATRFRGALLEVCRRSNMFLCLAMSLCFLALCSRAWPRIENSL